MFYRISYIILTVFSVAVLGLTVADSVIGGGSGLFSQGWVIFMFTAFVALQIVCLLKMKPTLKLHRIGFYILHFGLVLFLIGSFVYYSFGDKITVHIPVNGQTYSKIQRQENTEEFVDLGFGIGVADFKAEQYEDTGMDKYFEATLMLEDKTSLRVENKKLTVNNPVKDNGWKIYLFGNTPQNNTVTLLLKNDPAETVTDIGLWMSIIGAFLMCIRKKTGEAAE